MRKKTIFVLFLILVTSIGAAFAQFVFNTPKTSRIDTGIKLAGIHKFVKHNVTLDARGGKVNGKTTDTIVIGHGKEIALPTPQSTFGTSDYQTVWKDSLTGIEIADGFKVNAEMTLHAEYRFIQKGIVYTFNYNSENTSESFFKVTGYQGNLKPNDDGTTLHMDAVIDSYVVKEIAKDAFNGCNAPDVFLGLPKHVKKIGERAFANSDFSLVLLENDETNFLTSLEEIGAEAFYNCSGIGDINLPPTLRVIGSSAFRMCKNLRGIHFNGPIEKIVYLAFADNISLKEFTLTKENTKNLLVLDCSAFANTSISYALYVPQTAAILNESDLPVGMSIIKYY